MIITICGSTKFKALILNKAQELTMAGHIVLMPCVFHHADNVTLSTEDKIKLDNLHKEKIEMSDAIYVVNPDGYIGDSTKSEIDWAQRKKKRIIYLYSGPAVTYVDTPIYGPSDDIYGKTSNVYRPNTQIFSSTISGTREAPKASYTYTINDDEDGAPPGYKC